MRIEAEEFGQNTIAAMSQLDRLQAGEQAAQFLKNHSTTGLQPEMVKIRKRVYNVAAANKYHITVPSNFTAIK